MADLNVQLDPAFFAAIGDLERARVALRDEPRTLQHLEDSTVTLPSRTVSDLSAAAKRVFEQAEAFLAAVGQGQGA